MKNLIFTLFIFFTVSVFAQFTSIRHEESAYYKQFGNLTEVQWGNFQNVKKDIQQNSKSGCNLQYAVYGWHPYWMGTAYNNYDFSLLSTFCYFSYELVPSTGNYSTIHSWKTTNAINLAQAAGAKVELCVTNFGSSNNATFLTNPTAQQTLIDSLIALINYRNADGVNIDFEGVSGSNRNDLTNFMISLSNQLKAAIPGATVTMATYSVDWNNVFDFAVLNNYVDQFIIMGYGYYWSGSSTAGPTDPLYSGSIWSSYNLVRSINYHLNQGVSPNKLLIGLPYYGREWETNSSTVPSSVTGNYTTSRTYKYIKDNTSGNYSNTLWDDQSFTSYWVYQNAGNWRQAFVDDKKSLGYRYDMVKQKGIGGIGIWALGYDDGYTELWDLIRDKFTDCGTTPCSDTIYDMGGPYANYYDDENYTFTISPTGASRLNLSFSSFDLESGYDSLWIWDGPNTSYPLIGGYSGTNSPGIIQSSGNSLTLRFYSDGATVKSGWKAIYTCEYDTIRPVTSVDSVPTVSTNFSATFNDSDNAGGSGLNYLFMSVNNYNGTEWRANKNNGYFADEFNTSIHSDWVSYSGVWNITSGYLTQTDENNSNTNIASICNQNNFDQYLYHWKGRISGSGTNKRAGFHFMCDSDSLSNRGNSYFVWFREDDNKLQFYKVLNNTFSLTQETTFNFLPNQWYDFKVIFDKVAGKILVYIDDDFIDSWTDSSPLTVGNFISFRSGNAVYDIDELTVYHNRTNPETITVGSAPTNDITYQNPSPNFPAGKIKSIVTDNANNISLIDEQLINIDFTISIDEFSTKELKIYPNPVKNLLTITFKNANAKSLIIYNNLGQIITSQTVNKTTTINTSKWAKGLYILRINNQSFKVIKE